MKKQYTKPNLHVESFVLTQSVATGCGAVSNGEGHATWGQKGSCGWYDEAFGDTIWTESNRACDVYLSEDDPYESVCYNAPSGGNAIFHS